MPAATGDEALGAPERPSPDGAMQASGEPRSAPLPPRSATGSNGPDDDDPGSAALLQFLYRAPVGLIELGPDGAIGMINPMAAQLLMPLVADGNLTNLFDVLASTAPQLRGLTASAAAAPPGAVVCEGLRIPTPRPGDAAVGGPRVLALAITRIDAGTLVASLFDATASVSREEQRLAVHLRDATRLDALTGLPNRSVAMERIAGALTAARADPTHHFAVMCINCDRFDRINVSLGTAIGDQLLGRVGERLNAGLRIGDGAANGAADEPAAARLGNDEFVLVLEGLRDSDDALRIADRLVASLAKPYSVDEHLIHLTSSIGVVLGAEAVGNADDVLQSANIAMQEAKRAGGARCTRFDPVMRERALRLGSLETDLRHAIDARELFVVYQPIVELGTGLCIGAEALVRWRHPVRGVVPPIDFIGLAEETGLIVPIGRFVLEESCRQFMTWRTTLGAAAPRSMSVNLSRAQLRDGNFPGLVRAVLASNAMAAEHLQLEVTESLAAQDTRVRQQIEALKTLGVTIALDDFGTGYSSLASLHQLPVDVVKVDRSFVSQVESSMHHRVLIEATVMVARSLGMGTVAEGIETAAQASELTRLGCDKGQGYLLARPLDAGDATRWLVAHSAAESALGDPQLVGDPAATEPG